MAGRPQPLLASAVSVRDGARAAPERRRALVSEVRVRPARLEDIAARAMWLHDIFVQPSARGRGVGHALMAAVAAETVRLGGRSLEWGVHAANAGALAFYRRLGAAGGEARIMGLAGERLRALAS